MDITITTPALLFPAISVLFLAYSNRYLAIAKRIRELHNLFNRTQSHIAKKQVESLRIRIRLIIIMQALAVMGIICSVLTMALIFLGLQISAKTVFLLSMLLIVLSLLVSLWELLISTRALNIELEDMEVQ
ncbi:DUF2721 domain-containing protein [Methylomarinum sp. Ch1-1]|uniref:DUF2721 domain-containing protein n=1 Tax=Methylomarinum roseum TaxID=3067653 RepID=A0AAU7NZ41_9GAMM|nr:DUF2721 domain-containing protein [Methylomarinum sp. Ch1-1]MDP4521570.1 DUF2721 domain-containing protein [Methylomarinum sp. Ch1-1]